MKSWLLFLVTGFFLVYIVFLIFIHVDTYSCIFSAMYNILVCEFITVHLSILLSNIDSWIISGLFIFYLFAVITNTFNNFNHTFNPMHICFSMDMCLSEILSHGIFNAQIFCFFSSSDTYKHYKCNYLDMECSTQREIQAKALRWDEFVCSDKEGLIS